MFLFFYFPKFLRGIALCDLGAGELARWSLVGRGGYFSPVRYPSPYDVFTYIRDFSAYFDMQRSSMLPTAGSALTDSLGPGNGDSVTGAYCKRWKH